ncbi:MAG: hypothetical protein M3Q22_03850 [Actinomycetota bacterium]|nr:hypothetical protein [Actinomycetota bacterium]
MTNARLQKEAGVDVPGGRVHGTASYQQNALLHAEPAFIGSLLHMPRSMASEALGLVLDDDLADYLHQLIVTVIRRLVAEGSAPDPVAVLARARADGVVTGSTAVQAMASRLHDLYASVPTPASWRLYALGTVDDALRRQCITLGDRVAQAAESSALDVLIDVLDAECRSVRRLHERRLAVAGEVRPELRSVVA